MRSHVNRGNFLFENRIKCGVERVGKLSFAVRIEKNYAKEFCLKNSTSPFESGDYYTVFMSTNNLEGL